MSLHEYLSVLRRSWLLIVVSTVLGILLGLAATLLTTPVYKAQAELFVSVKSAGAASDAYSGGLFVQQRVKSYINVVHSPAVLDPVIKELRLNTSNDELAGQVSAETPEGTVLLDVTASDTSPEKAAAITNAVAASYAREIARLEGANSGTKAADQGQVPVQATVIRPAKVPTSPVSPNKLLNLALGFFLGFGVGVSIALLRHTLDTTVKNTEELTKSSGATTLGVVTFDPDAKQHPLVTLRGTARAEAFRTIRTNLQYVDVDNPPKTVVVTSSLPSEGKSTAACNLAIAWAQAGSRVALLEADLRRPKVGEYLGVTTAGGMTDILIGKATLDETVISWQRGLLDFLPAGAIPPNPSELLGSHQMAELLTELKNRYDVVVLDAPPLLPVTDAAILAAVADGAILIARHGKTRREQVKDSVEALRQVNARILGTILNFAPERKRRGKYGYGYGYGYGYESQPASEEVEGTPAPSEHKV